ncbi:hypothetical protein AAKU64_003085 [Undibacterium sp. GrIS 1.8]
MRLLRKSSISNFTRFAYCDTTGIAEYSKTRNDATAVPDSTRYVLGLEYRIAEGSYLTLGGARDSGKDSKNSLLANLNFGFGKSSIFGQ